MKKTLYIDREFKNSVGGDKNRSRYIYDVLEKNSSAIFMCIIKDTGEVINSDTFLELVASKKKSRLLPNAIVTFSDESKNILVSYIEKNNIKTLFRIKKQF